MLCARLLLRRGYSADCDRYLFTCACDACTDAGSEARESNKEAWREGTVSEDQRDEAVAACADACAAAERGRAGGDELLRILREACAQGEAARRPPEANGCTRERFRRADSRCGPSQALDPLHVGLMRAREHALRLAIALAEWKEVSLNFYQMEKARQRPSLFISRIPCLALMLSSHHF